MAVLSSSLFAGAVHAQTGVQVFLGYSYLRPTVTDQASANCAPAPGCPGAFVETVHPNVNGWEGAIALNPTKIFGITGAFDANYGSIQGSTLHFQTYLVGPQIHFPGRISPFFHVLLGGARETIGSNGLAFTASPGRSLALEAGGGVDIKLGSYFSVRAIQVDYLRTDFSEFDSTTQNQLRASAGIVIHF